MLILCLKLFVLFWNFLVHQQTSQRFEGYKDAKTKIIGWIIFLISLCNVSSITFGCFSTDDIDSFLPGIHEILSNGLCLAFAGLCYRPALPK